MTQEMISVPREQYERLKKERLVLFGANNGQWSDEELENNAVATAIAAAGQVIESGGLTDRPLSTLTREQFSTLIQQACWKYMEVYVDYVPF